MNPGNVRTAFFRGRGWREYISFDSVWRPASCPVLSRARGSFALLHRVRSTCIVGSFSSHAKNSPTHMWLRSIHVHVRGMCMHACMPPERWIRRPGGPAKLNHVRCSVVLLAGVGLFLFENVSVARSLGWPGTGLRSLEMED